MISRITNGIIFRINLILFMCTSLFIDAGHLQRAVEWRPKGAVSIPKESCVFMGSNINDKSKATLWALMGSFVVRSEKNKWRKVSPDCTDELVRSMDDKRMEAFTRAQGKFLITQLNDSSYFVRGAIPGKGGGPWLGWLGYAIVKVAVPAIIAKVTGRAIDNVSIAIQSSRNIPEVAKPITDMSMRGMGYMAETYAFTTSFDQHPALEYSQGMAHRMMESPYAPTMAQATEDTIVAAGAMLLAGESVAAVGVGTATECVARALQVFLTALPTP